MPRALILRHGDVELSFTIEKLDRTKLYGSVDVEAIDDQHQARPQIRANRTALASISGLSSNSLGQALSRRSCLTLAAPGPTAA